MDLPRSGREYAHVAFHDLPADPPTPQILLGGTWHPMAWWDDYEDPEWARQAAAHGLTQAQAEAGTHSLARILLAGPDAPDNPAGTPVLTGPRTRSRARLIAGTEILERDLDPIDLVG